tara:strand:+ start:175 stop:609 length:435 start_codon:yes stop_codon:yes gene_type:complete
MLDGFFNSIFGSLIEVSPLMGLLVISFLLTLLISLSYKLLTDQKLMKEHKDEITQLQKEMKELKDNPTLMMEKQKILMEKNLKMMKHNFKPMLFTFIPLIIIFGWLRETYAPMGKLIFGLSWFWVYLISAVIFSIIIRKLLKIY